MTRTDCFTPLVTVVLGVGGCLGYFYGSNPLLDRLFPARRQQ